MQGKFVRFFQEVDTLNRCIKFTIFSHRSTCLMTVTCGWTRRRSRRGPLNKHKAAGRSLGSRKRLRTIERIVTMHGDTRRHSNVSAINLLTWVRRTADDNYSVPFFIFTSRFGRPALLCERLVRGMSDKNYAAFLGLIILARGKMTS